jgi:hypothetical protein
MVRAMVAMLCVVCAFASLDSNIAAIKPEPALIFSSEISIGSKKHPMVINQGTSVVQAVEEFCSKYAVDAQGEFFAVCKKELMKSVPVQMGEKRVEAAAQFHRAKQREGVLEPDSVDLNVNTLKVLFSRDISMGGAPAPFKIIAGESKSEAIARFCNKNAHDAKGGFQQECNEYLEENVKIDDVISDRILFYQQHKKTLSSKVKALEDTEISADTLIHSVSVQLTLGHVSIDAHLDFHSTLTKKQALENFCHTHSVASEVFYYYDFKYTKSCINHLKSKLNGIVPASLNKQLDDLEKARDKAHNERTEATKDEEVKNKAKQAEAEAKERAELYGQHVKNALLYKQMITMGGKTRTGKDSLPFIVYEGQTVDQAVAAFCHEHVLEHHRELCEDQFRTSLPIDKAQRAQFAAAAKKYKDSPMSAGLGAPAQGTFVPAAKAKTKAPAEEEEEFEL